ncbi:MAG: DUF455 family protein [Planctomycetota bacterium]
MELRALAEGVLLGGRLADKLRAPTEPLSDAAPGEARAVAEPARAGALRWRPEEAEVPPATRLEEPRRRAALLHAFANHELLATELFAHALLRWPDAPAGFRRGLAQTLLDEQRHLGLYVARLEALGVPFGELPLNRYLWDAMAAVPDPPTFVAVMALTFEQANLDHMRSTAQALRAVGDEASAAILDQIGREEVQHVALGLRWFERWRVRPRHREQQAGAPGRSASEAGGGSARPASGGARERAASAERSRAPWGVSPRACPEGEEWDRP